MPHTTSLSSAVDFIPPGALNPLGRPDNVLSCDQPRPPEKSAQRRTTSQVPQDSSSSPYVPSAAPSTPTGTQYIRSEIHAETGAHVDLVSEYEKENKMKQRAELKLKIDRPKLQQLEKECKDLEKMLNAKKLLREEAREGIVQTEVKMKEVEVRMKTLTSQMTIEQGIALGKRLASHERTGKKRKHPWSSEAGPSSGGGQRQKLVATGRVPHSGEAALTGDSLRDA
ncbi:hypothetical protein K491DRAFT_711247 [Lophiostoma macrostomum CBS 122681]|uniref:Uncharacterized protein n=1 Tax=Lophiostoma macrostomum CBS 122681 TaxID=1314788 RepID=A0A6A6TQV3_9PLEO|nr:hypothetical protein K491DRAFT_711247 [Lophiostoma macrostomum CBS 122681]